MVLPGQMPGMMPMVQLRCLPTRVVSAMPGPDRVLHPDAVWTAAVPSVRRQPARTYEHLAGRILLYARYALADTDMGCGWQPPYPSMPYGMNSNGMPGVPGMSASLPSPTSYLHYTPARAVRCVVLTWRHAVLPGASGARPGEPRFRFQRASSAMSGSDSNSECLRLSGSSAQSLNSTGQFGITPAGSAPRQPLCPYAYRPSFTGTNRPVCCYQVLEASETRRCQEEGSAGRVLPGARLEVPEGLRVCPQCQERPQCPDCREPMATEPGQCVLRMDANTATECSVGVQRLRLRVCVCVSVGRRWERSRRTQRLAQGEQGWSSQVRRSCCCSGF